MIRLPPPLLYKLVLMFVLPCCVAQRAVFLPATGLRSVCLPTRFYFAILPLFSSSPAKPCRTKVPRARARVQAGRPPEKEYGTTPRSRRMGPASVGCSPLRALRFATTPPGQVDVDPSATEDATLEAEASRALQKGPCPHPAGTTSRRIPPPRGAARRGVIAPPGTGGVLAPTGTGAGGVRLIPAAAADPAGAGETGGAVAAAPGTATAGARAAARSRPGRPRSPT